MGYRECAPAMEESECQDKQYRPDQSGGMPEFTPVETCGVPLFEQYRLHAA